MPTQIVQRVPDVRLVQNVYFPKYSVTLDWSLTDNGTLDDTQALATAVCVALGTNSLADIDDRLPDPDSTDRQGWWGDMDAEEIWKGWPIGCKIWLESRSAVESRESMWGATQTRVMNYIRDSMQAFVDHKIATQFALLSTRVDKQRIDVGVRLYRGPKAAVDLMYQLLWQEIRA
jgi:phage gp46-like protein